MVEEFIRTRGVTPCPSFGTAEFRELNISREKAREHTNREQSNRWVRAKAARLQKALRP